MTTDRILTEPEILDALSKGQERAQHIIAQANDDVETLRSQFDQAVWACEHCLENFSMDEFFERDNHQKGAQFLKKILLGAFKAVQCIDDLQGEINSKSVLLMHEGRASTLQIALLKAVTVYGTNGRSDVVSLCVERKISEYRLSISDHSQEPLPPAPLPRSA